MTIPWYGAKLHLGSGAHPLSGWINADAVPALGTDVLLDLNQDGMAAVPDGSLMHVYSSHVIEHVYPDRLPAALRHIHRALLVGGRLTLATVSLEGIYQNAYLKGYSVAAWNAYLYGDTKSTDSPFMAHRQAFTEPYLTGMLKEAGFAAVRPWKLTEYPEFAALNDCAASSWHVTLYLEATK